MNKGNEDKGNPDRVVVLLALLFFFSMVLLLIILCIYAILRRRTYIELPLPRSNRSWVQRLSSFSSTREDRHLRPGLDVKIIEALPIFVYTSSSQSFKLGETGTDCSVCLQDFVQGEKVRVLPDCKHSFHTECIDMWFHSHSNCPLCRTKVEARIEEDADLSNGAENVVVDMNFAMEQGHNSSSFTSETIAEIDTDLSTDVNSITSEDICSPSGSRFCRLHSFTRMLSGRSRDGRVFPSTQNEIGDFS